MRWTYSNTQGAEHRMVSRKYHRLITFLLQSHVTLSSVFTGAKSGLHFPIRCAWGLIRISTQLPDRSEIVLRIARCNLSIKIREILFAITVHISVKMDKREEIRIFVKVIQIVGERERVMPNRIKLCQSTVFTLKRTPCDNAPFLIRSLHRLLKYYFPL